MPRQYIKNSAKNSVLYLALFCLIFFWLPHYASDIIAKSFDTPNPRELMYLEIVEETSSTVLKISTKQELKKIAHKYNINNSLKNDHKVILEDEKGIISGRISGIKSISLGIPLGVNSAGIEDLKALPGIGDKLARRIAEYREANGRIENVDELPSVEGVGLKKLAAIKDLISLD